MRKGKEDVVDITTPMTAAEVEEPVHLKVGRAYQEEGQDVDDEEDDF